MRRLPSWAFGSWECGSHPTTGTDRHFTRLSNGHGSRGQQPTPCAVGSAGATPAQLCGRWGAAPVTKSEVLAPRWPPQVEEITCHVDGTWWLHVAAWAGEPVWDSGTQGGVGLSSVSGLLGLRQPGGGGLPSHSACLPSWKAPEQPGGQRASGRRREGTPRHCPEPPHSHIRSQCPIGVGFLIPRR